MRLLAIHHEPQECGLPFIIFVDLETGEELPDRTITIDGDYRDSGMEIVEQWKHTGKTHTRRIHNCIPPEIGSIEFIGYQGKWMVTDIARSFKPDRLGLETVTVQYEKVLPYMQKRYLSPDKDEFRVSLASQGIDMTGWNVYKRHKTPYKDFIRAIMPEEVVNVIFI